MRRGAAAAALWALCAAGIAACSGSPDAVSPSGTGGDSLLVVSIQPQRIGEIGVCNQFQLWVTAASVGNAVAVDSTQWTSGDSTAISVGRNSGLLTSHHETGSITITVTAWSGTKFGSATGLWDASPYALVILDPNGNPYPEPSCP